MARSSGFKVAAIVLLVLGALQTIHAYNQEFASEFLTTLNVVSTTVLVLGLAAFAIALWDGRWSLVPAARMLTLGAMVLNVVLTDASADTTALAHIGAYAVVGIIVLLIPTGPTAKDNR